MRPLDLDKQIQIKGKTWRVKAVEIDNNIIYYHLTDEKKEMRISHSELEKIIDR